MCTLKQKKGIHWGPLKNLELCVQQLTSKVLVNVMYECGCVYLLCGSDLSWKWLARHLSRPESRPDRSSSLVLAFPVLSKNRTVGLCFKAEHIGIGAALWVKSVGSRRYFSPSSSHWAVQKSASPLAPLFFEETGELRRKQRIVSVFLLFIFTFDLKKRSLLK